MEWGNPEPVPVNADPYTQFYLDCDQEDGNAGEKFYPLIFRKRQGEKTTINPSLSSTQFEQLLEGFQGNKELLEGLRFSEHEIGENGALFAENSDGNVTIFSNNPQNFSNTMSRRAADDSESSETSVAEGQPIYEFLGLGLGVDKSQLPSSVQSFQNLQTPGSFVKRQVKVITVVIDADIPILNRRYRSSETETRIMAHWAMGMPSGKAARTTLSPGRGRLFFEADINELLRDVENGKTERETYEELGAFESSSPLKHGAQSLECAAGYDMTDPRAGRHGIITVQLPYDAVAATNGYILKDTVIDALSWVESVLKEIKKDLPDVAVVLNYSFGPLAGRHDGQEVLTQELEGFASDVGLKPVAVTLPAGNSLQSQTHGRFTGQDLQSDRVATWVVQSDSKAKHFMQIWTPRGFDQRQNQSFINPITLNVTPPGGPTLTISVLGSEKHWNLRDAATDTLLAQLSWRVSAHFGATPRQYITIATRPTSPHACEPTIQPGRWTFEVKNVDNNAGLQPNELLELWAERSDTPSGFPKGGRQSYFHDPNYRKWADTGEYLMVDVPADAYVKRHGTLNPLATGQKCIVAGSHIARNMKLHFFTSYGLFANNQNRGPDLTVASGLSEARDYTVGAGILSGETVRSNGTSVSSALTARAAAELVLAKNPRMNVTFKQFILKELFPSIGHGMTHPDKGLGSKTIEPNFPQPGNFS